MEASPRDIRLVIPKQHIVAVVGQAKLAQPMDYVMILGTSREVVAQITHGIMSNVQSTATRLMDIKMVRQSSLHFPGSLLYAPAWYGINNRIPGTIDGPNYLLPCGIYILAKTWSCAQKNAYGTGIPNCTSERLIRFESPDDIALLPSNSTASTSSTASSASQTNPNTTTSPSSSGVSGGTIGAAVVAGILGLAFLITLGFLLVGIKRRRVERDEADRKISELHSQSMMHPGEVKYPHEAASPPVELAATGRNSELPG